MWWNRVGTLQFIQLVKSGCCRSVRSQWMLSGLCKLTMVQFIRCFFGTSTCLDVLHFFSVYIQLRMFICLQHLMMLMELLCWWSWTNSKLHYAVDGTPPCSAVDGTPPITSVSTQAVYGTPQSSAVDGTPGTLLLLWKSVICKTCEPNSGLVVICAYVYLSWSC